ncbi:hypothetical protein ELUMI_v1c02750 [Williamsoniiplasma luminosum]|uniref:MOLPALP family lipoprotein n=1 Tax=Williamsoniiplasma luminosum TaxID=214888 RepID=A0A2K8NT40_9MOLU|nr:hypothetical protein [Williamsoniiplasma luminosum]ATZ17000.1 hypothetical protein ELUMI_v1c02750 [Williamsoniiplasma luminosum]
MKKLLTLLGATIITCSSTMTLISCDNSKNHIQTSVDEQAILDIYLQEIAKIAYLSKEKGYDTNYLFQNFVANKTIKELTAKNPIAELNSKKINNLRELQKTYFTTNVIDPEIDIKEGIKPEKASTSILQTLAPLIGMLSNPKILTTIGPVLPGLLTSLNLGGESGIGNLLEKILDKNTIDLLTNSFKNDKYSGKTFQQAIDISSIKFVNAINKIIGVNTQFQPDNKEDKEAALKSLVKNLGEFISSKKTFNFSILSNIKEIVDIVEFVRLLLIYLDKIENEPPNMTWVELKDLLERKVDDFSNEVDVKKVFSSLLDKEKMQNLLKSLFWGKEEYITMESLDDISSFMKNFDNENYTEIGFTPIIKALVNSFMPSMGGYMTGLLGILSKNSPIAGDGLASLASVLSGLIVGMLPGSIPQNFKKIIENMLSNKQFFTHPWDYLWSKDFVKAIMIENSNVANNKAEESNEKEIENFLDIPLKKLTGLKSILQHNLSDKTSIRSIVEKVTKAGGELKIDFDNFVNLINKIPALTTFLKDPTNVSIETLGIQNGKIIPGSLMDSISKIFQDLKGIVSIEKSLQASKESYNIEHFKKVHQEMQDALNAIKVTKVEFLDDEHIITLNNTKIVKFKLDKIHNKSQIMEINITQ